MFAKHTLAVAILCIAPLAGTFAACSSSDTRPTRGLGTGGAGGSVSLGNGGTGLGLGIGGIGLSTDGGSDCANSLSGTVYDPAGKLPLFNVVVYVPSEPLADIADGASCQTCDGNFSGKPVAAVLSDAAGKFRLCLDKVPSLTNIPLVIQIGKWRRELTVPSVKAGDNPMDDGTVRLPRNRTEGHLPHIAVVRGGSDALECLFRKIGISDSEITLDSGDGRVHLYASDDGSAEPGTTQLADGTAIPLGGTLYASLDKLMTYDAVFLACEGGGRGTFDKYGDLEFGNMATYADRGGRIFGSHYQNYWVRPDKFDTLTVTYPAVATFASSQHGFGVDVTGDVDTSFPKGETFRDWLVNVGASDTPGKLLIHDGEHTVDAVIPGTSTQWVSVDPDPNGHHAVQYYSFTTPVGQPECGRMVFSDLHVASGTGDSGKIAFPTGCVSTTLSPQEKALAFMLFDLSSCVQPDDAPITIPKIY